MVRRAKLLALTCLTSFGVVSLSSIQTQVHAQSTIVDSLMLPASQAGLILLAQNPGMPSAAEELPLISNPVLLAPGSRGSNVVILQQQLQQLGYYKGSLDGVYGSGTQRAVRDFQAQAALPATGSLDQLTWQQMQTPQAFSNSSSAASASPSDVSATAPLSNPGGFTAPQNLSPETAIPSPSNPAASTPIAASTTNPASSQPSNTGGIVAPSPTINLPVDNAPDQSPTEQQSASRGGHVMWVAIALLSLLLILTSTALLAIFVWKRLQQQSLNSKLLPQANFADPGHPTTAMDAPLNNHITVQNQAGQQSNSSSGRWANSHIRLTETSLVPTGVEETTRLSRVNITDQLVADLASQDSNQRHKTIWELGQRGNSTAIQPLVDAMIDADSKERSLILAALSEIGMRTLKPMNRALAVSLQDENPEVRKNAIRDLTRVYEQISQISQMLGRAIQDNDAEVQATAQWALEQLSRIRSLPSSPLSGTDAAEPSAQPPNDSSRTSRS